MRESPIDSSKTFLIPRRLINEMFLHSEKVKQRNPADRNDCNHFLDFSKPFNYLSVSSLHHPGTGHWAYSEYCLTFGG